MKRIFVTLFVIVMLLSFVSACGPAKPVETEAPETTGKPIETEEPEEPEDLEPWLDDMTIAVLGTKEYGKDYISLYEKYGKEVTIADVEEDPDTGLAYIEKDGEKYELGLDFLSMANVYNTDPAGDYETADDVYAAWWKLYLQRWNHLLPEIPLYSNEYYDLYNAQIKGVEDYPTNPYWNPASALIDWSSEKSDDSIIIGNTTELSGKFRFPSFGATNPAASDNDVGGLVNGLETVSATKEGGYVWNSTVVADHKETDNPDGTKTFEITINEDLVFSDGSPVTAKDYVVFTMVFSSPVGAEAAGTDHLSGRTFVGFKAFNKYDGTESEESAKEFAGIRLIDDYTFSVTVAEDFLPYFYDILYGGFTAQYHSMWTGGADILDDGEGVYFADEFYAKAGDAFAVADKIKQTALNTDTTYPYSGAYVVKSFDKSDSSAVLEINPNFKGNYEGATPEIGKVVYKRVISETQLEDFKSGNLDVIAAITGGDATNEALALADASDGAYVYTHYSRAGYGKLGFRADYGTAQFAEVRAAIAYCMDRAKFAKDFTGGYGGVVDGPYYQGAWFYKAAVADGMLLDSYPTSAESAIEVLEEAGWIYDKDGNPYTDGVRYRKFTEEQLTENDKKFKSKDGAYVTTQVDGYYYMPLVLNWFGTTDNEFTDLLVTGFQTADNVTAAGMVVQSQFGDFAPMLDELYQEAVYGYYAGEPMYNVFNFATGFGSAVYDFAFGFTIDPDTYEDDSAYYVKDVADVYWLP